MDKKSVAAFLGEVETYLSVLAPGLLLRPLLEWAAAFRAQAIETSDVIAYEVADGNLFDWNLKEVSEALGTVLHKVCRGSAGIKLQAVSKVDGFNSWRLFLGEVHEGLHVSADDDHEPREGEGLQ